MSDLKKTVVINIVGLSPRLIGKHTPFIESWSKTKTTQSVKPVIPAVTCTAQTTYLTGKYPNEHGIVANGWYFKDEAEVKLWRQSNRLVQSEKIWETAKKHDSSFTCANLFWWYNMYSSVEYSVTPRPMYPADGRKIPDVYTHPMELRDELQDALGQFPLFKFWGPATSIEVSQWIGESAKFVETKYDPTLSLIYIPHLDYNCQRHGPNHKSVEKDLQDVDDLCKDLITFYEAKGAKIVLLSGYGITEVDRPIHINRILRKADMISYRMENGREMIDPGASDAFAMADHQIAHIYVKDKANIPNVKALLSEVKGIVEILDEDSKADKHLDHDRSGDLIAIADAKSWFTYYYWLDDQMAPDYARTVDIHRKPGYDPVEMFLNPKIMFPKLKIAGKLIRKILGFRTLMDVIPLDASLIKGSHGHLPADKQDWPIYITEGLDSDTDYIEAHQVYEKLCACMGINMKQSDKPT